ncbi:MAG: T9SS type A sorting domain-containing protein [Hyphomicrobiales bacterium]
MKKITIRFLLAFMFIGLFSTNILAQDIQKTFKLILEDTEGDGWYTPWITSGDIPKSTISVWKNDVVIFEEITVEKGQALREESFQVEKDDVIKVKVTPRKETGENEISWRIEDALGDKIVGQGPGLKSEEDFPEVSFTAVIPPLVDVTINDLMEPLSSDALTDQETVKVSLTNNGVSTITKDFNITYTADGKSVTEVVTGQSIPSNGTFEYSFTEKADLSAKGVHNISISVDIAGEENPDDNTHVSALININASGFFYQIGSLNIDENNSVYKGRLPLFEQTEKSELEVAGSFDCATGSIDGQYYGISSAQQKLVIYHPKTKEVERLYPANPEVGSDKFISLDYCPILNKMIMFGKSNFSTRVYVLDPIYCSATLFTELVGDYDIATATITKTGRVFVYDNVSKKILEYDRANNMLVDFCDIHDKAIDELYYVQMVTDFVNDDIYLFTTKSKRSVSKTFYIDKDSKEMLYLGENINKQTIVAAGSYRGDKNLAQFLNIGIKEDVTNHKNQKFPARIDDAKKEITIPLFYGKEKKQHPIIYTTNEGATVQINDEAFESGDKLDGSKEYTLTVTSEDGTITNDYKLKFYVCKNHECNINEFSLVGQAEDCVVIENFQNLETDEYENRIKGFISYNDDITKVKPVFKLSDQAFVQVRGRTVISGVTKIDCSKPVIFTVVAEDGSSKDYILHTKVINPPSAISLNTDSYNEKSPEVFENGLTGVCLKWTKAESSPEYGAATGYKIYLNDGLNGDISASVGETRGYVIGDLEPSVEYQIKVVAYNGAGESTDNKVYKFVAAEEKTYSMKTGVETVDSGIFVDSGYDGNYKKGEDYTLTFKSSKAGEQLVFVFDEFLIYNTQDFLAVYNGTEVIEENKIEGSPFTDSQLKGETIHSDNAEGALTFKFASKEIKMGWKARFYSKKFIDQDIAVEEVIMPDPEFEFTNTENIKVRIKNVGNADISNPVTIEYSFGDGHALNTTKEVTFDSPLKVGAARVISQSFDFSAKGTYNLNVKAVLAEDTNLDDNTLSGETYTVDKFSCEGVKIDFEDLDTDASKYIVSTGEESSFSYETKNPIDGSRSIALKGGSWNGWSSVPSYKKSTAFNMNLAHQSRLRFKIDASSLSSLLMSFDKVLFQKQAGYDEIYFQIKIDDEQVYTEFLTDNKDKHQVLDLSKYAGKIFELEFDVRAKTITEFLLLDNIEFIVPGNIDPAISKLSFRKNPIVRVFNKGTDPISKVKFECSIDGGTKETKEITLDQPLNIFESKDITIEGLTIPTGQHQMQINIIAEGDADLTNNQQTLDFYGKPTINTFPYIEDFESDDHHWTVEGKNSSWELATPAGENINSAYSGSKAWVTNADGAHNKDEISKVESPDFDLSAMEKPIVALFMNYSTLDENIDVEYSTDFGANWASLPKAPTSKNWETLTDSWVGDSKGWCYSYTSDLSGNIKQEHVRFRIYFNGTQQGEEEEGVAFDDFRIFEKSQVTNIKLAEVVSPVDLNKKGNITPTVKLQNKGVANITTDVTLTIKPTNETFTKTVTDLAPEGETDVVFDTWEAVQGEYELSFSITTTNDLDPTDDKKTVNMDLDNAEMLTFKIDGFSEVWFDKEKCDINLESSTINDFTTLKAIFTVSPGATVKIGDVVQESGVTENSFIDPVTYTIVAADGTEKTYTVTVHSPQDKSTDFISFSVIGGVGIPYINTETKEIIVEVPYGMDVTAVSPSFKVGGNALIEIDGELQMSGITEVDFTNPVTYVITAQVGFVAEWTVTLVNSYNEEAKLVAFAAQDAIDGTVVIDEENKTIKFSAFSIADLTQQKLTFSLSYGASLYNGEEALESEVSLVDVSSPVALTVYAENPAYSNVYTLSVDVIQTSSDASLSELKVDGELVADFNAATLTYTVELPKGTTVTPTVTAKATNDDATVEITPATDITDKDNIDNRTTKVVVTAEDGATKLTYNVKFDVDVSVGELELTNVNIYPNPAKDFVNVTNANGSKLQLIDASGNVINTMEVNSNSVRVNLGQNTGLYFIRLINENNTKVFKVGKCM